MKKKKVLFISSTGGHLEELMQLKTMFDKYDYYIVTEKTKSNLGLREKYKGRISYLIYGSYSIPGVQKPVLKQMPPGFPCPFSTHIKYIQVRKNYPCLLFFQNGKSTAPHTQILLNDPSSWKSPENVQCHFLKEQTVPVKEAVLFLKPGSLAVILSSKSLFHS